MENTNQFWTDYKEQNKLIEKLDIEIGKILDEDVEKFKDLNMAMIDLEEKEFLTDSEYFQDVKDRIEDLYKDYSAVKEKKSEKLLYEEKLKEYFEKVEIYFDNLIKQQTKLGNINLM